jgi:hypothetical protein
MDEESGTHERGMKYIQSFDGKAEGKRLIGRPWRRWEISILIDLSKIGWGGRDRIHVAQDRDQ